MPSKSGVKRMLFDARVGQHQNASPESWPSGLASSTSTTLCSNERSSSLSSPRAFAKKRSRTPTATCIASHNAASDNIAQKQLIAQLFGLKTHFELVSFPRNRAVRVHMAKPCWRPFSATERLFDLGGERRFLSLG
eukprot:CAMPEP_0177696842 /NCGR_PEP_ID=MMETSP0484_2-20121128/4196_1 /TAXON_ID=354590 /ORGANISM="Rhodomonas lens, Strain RHODO" /LENGTH=135 /DNA_ID=CAMNT_0019207841 /DNA_START=1204 /DNA_END=1611 /DNA_ORIENTATION=+